MIEKVLSPFYQFPTASGGASPSKPYSTSVGWRFASDSPQEAVARPVELGQFPIDDVDGFVSASAAVAAVTQANPQPSQWYVVRNIAHGALVFADESRCPGNAVKGIGLESDLTGFEVKFWDPRARTTRKIPDFIVNRLRMWLEQHIVHGISFGAMTAES